MIARRIQTGAAALVLSLSSSFVLFSPAAYAAAAGPANFTAAYNTTTQQVDLSWDAVPPDASFTYDIYGVCVKPSSVVDWACATYDKDGTDTRNTSSLNASVAGYYSYPEGGGVPIANQLVFGESYDFQVGALQNGVPGSNTEPSTITNIVFGEVAESSSASAPRSLSAELYGGVDGIGNDRFYVSWETPLLTGSSAIVGYSLNVREVGQTDWIEYQATSTSTIPGAYIGETIIPLVDGKDYEFMVAAINADTGTSSNKSQITKTFNINTPAAEVGATDVPPPTTIEVSDSQPKLSVQVLDNSTLIIKAGGERDVIRIEGGTLKGVGKVGVIDMVSGKVAPGLSPGILNSGNLVFTGGVVEIEIGGSVAGNEVDNHDQINVVGTVDLGASTTLTTILYNDFAPSVGDRYTIINNDGTDTVTGAFSGLVEGASFTQNDVTYSISYVGGDGNDVVLTVTGGAATVGAPDTGAAALFANPMIALLGTVLVLGGVVAIRKQAYQNR